MKDEMGRGYWQRKREKKFMQIHAPETPHGENKGENETAKSILALTQYTSFRSVLRAMLPQLIIGSILGYVEYDLVGSLYTMISLIIYVPLIYFYSRSLRKRQGVYIMVPTSDFLDWDRMFVSEEIWDLMQKETGLTLEEGKINGMATYWCTDVDYINGTNVPYHVVIAWAHYNRAKYAMFESVIDDLTDITKSLMLEVAKLQKMWKVGTIQEGLRQTDETFDALAASHKEGILAVLKRIKQMESEANKYGEDVDSLLKSPTYVNELLKKVNEGEKNAESNSS